MRYRSKDVYSELGVAPELSLVMQLVDCRVKVLNATFCFEGAPYASLPLLPMQQACLSTLALACGQPATILRHIAHVLGARC